MEDIRYELRALDEKNLRHKERVSQIVVAHIVFIISCQDILAYDFVRIK